MSPTRSSTSLPRTRRSSKAASEAVEGAAVNQEATTAVVEAVIEEGVGVEAVVEDVDVGGVNETWGDFSFATTRLDDRERHE